MRTKLQYVKCFLLAFSSWLAFPDGLFFGTPVTVIHYSPSNSYYYFCYFPVGHEGINFPSHLDKIGCNCFHG